MKLPQFLTNLFPFMNRKLIKKSTSLIDVIKCNARPQDKTGTNELCNISCALLWINFGSQQQGPIIQTDTTQTTASK